MSKGSAYSKSFVNLGRKRLRKNPRIHPIAKSKMFNIRQPTLTDPIESQLKQRWWSEYKLQYAAVRNLLSYEFKQKEAELAATVRTDDEGDRQKRLLLNEQWNRQTRSNSLFHLTAALDQHTVLAESRMHVFDKVASDERDFTASKIALVSTLSSDCITRENIDSKLEEIMDSDIVDYNFVVDKSGTIIRGSDPLAVASSPSSALPENTTDNSTTDSLSVRV